ncbi:MAG: hypothetical protein ACXVFN_03090 [Solirubrobacteraceae bacterium]
MAARQDGVVAVWQLLAAGMGRSAVEHRVRGLRALQDGVYLTSAPAPTRSQRLWAAPLTAPDRYISHASAGHAFGFRPWTGAFEVVSCAGSGGHARLPSLLVCRSTTLSGNTTRLDGLPITTAERALADLARHLDRSEFARCVREALRLRVTTCARLQVSLIRAAPRNRPAALVVLAKRYARLPIARARSDAEAHALEILDAAGYPAPQVNVTIAGHMPDLAWPHVHHIVELDGPGFHQFPDVDLARQGAWERAGWTVARLPTDDVYDRPQQLLDAAAPALAQSPHRQPDGLTAGRG